MKKKIQFFIGSFHFAEFLIGQRRVIGGNIFFFSVKSRRFFVFFLRRNYGIHGRGFDICLWIAVPAALSSLLIGFNSIEIDLESLKKLEKFEKKFGSFVSIFRHFVFNFLFNWNIKIYF